MAALFADTIVDARVVSDASALKMAYAAWTKGSAALIIAAHRLAEALGVEDELDEEWRARRPDRAPRGRAARGASRRAGAGSARWRRSPTRSPPRACPTGFHRAAAEVYRDDAPVRGGNVARRDDS